MVVAAWTSLASRYPDVTFDAFVLMPNHFHALVSLGTEHVDSHAPVTTIVQWFKTITTDDYMRGV